MQSLSVLSRQNHLKFGRIFVWPNFLWSKSMMYSILNQYVLTKNNFFSDLRTFFVAKNWVCNLFHKWTDILTSIHSLYGSMLVYMAYSPFLAHPSEAPRLTRAIRCTLCPTGVSEKTKKCTANKFYNSLHFSSHKHSFLVIAYYFIIFMEEKKGT